MVQFECPRYGNPSVSSTFGWIPFLIFGSGVIKFTQFSRMVHELSSRTVQSHKAYQRTQWYPIHICQIMCAHFVFTHLHFTTVSVSLSSTRNFTAPQWQPPSCHTSSVIFLRRVSGFTTLILRKILDCLAHANRSMPVAGEVCAFSQSGSIKKTCVSRIVDRRSEAIRGVIFASLNIKYSIVTVILITRVHKWQLTLTQVHATVISHYVRGCKHIIKQVPTITKQNTNRIISVRKL